jgi:hypothetical protein
MTRARARGLPNMITGWARDERVGEASGRGTNSSFVVNSAARRKTGPDKAPFPRRA